MERYISLKDLHTEMRDCIDKFEIVMEQKKKTHTSSASGVSKSGKRPLKKILEDDKESCAKKIPKN